MPTGAGDDIAAEFLFSLKIKKQKGGLHKPTFFSILYTGEYLFIVFL
jgi:hypothetical protein